jgi:hypothetical protein
VERELYPHFALLTTGCVRRIRVAHGIEHCAAWPLPAHIREHQGIVLQTPGPKQMTTLHRVRLQDLKDPRV